MGTSVSAGELSYHLAEWEKSNKEEYLQRLLDRLNVGPHRVVLDLGCGTGYISAYLSRHATPSWNLAFDIDLRPLVAGRELMLPHRQGVVHWACASAEAVPLRSGSVDHLICRGVLPLTDVAASTTEIARLLSSGGSTLMLLHRWLFYARRLSLRPSKWKGTLVALLALLSGLVFHFTGVQWRPRVGRRRFSQSFQTVSRMRRLLDEHGLKMYHVELKPEFLTYARKVDGGTEARRRSAET